MTTVDYEVKPVDTNLDHFTVSFPEGYDDRLAFETPSKGYLRDVIVQLDDGTRYKLFFIDPVRLEQDLQADVGDRREYYAEPGMVVLPEVTAEAIRKAISGLLRDGFFRWLKSVPS
jgi:hypothetical protein